MLYSLDFIDQLTICIGIVYLKVTKTAINIPSYIASALLGKYRITLSAVFIFEVIRIGLYPNSFLWTFY